MTHAPIDTSRRAFFRRLITNNGLAGGLAGEAGRELAAAARLAEWESVFESELRAFGTDVLGETARHAGLAAHDADYSGVARALAGHMGDTDDERA